MSNSNGSSSIPRDLSTFGRGPAAATEVDHAARDFSRHLSMRRTDGDRNEPYRGGNGHRARTHATQFSRSQMSLRLSPLTASRANAAIGAELRTMLVFLQPECKRITPDYPGRSLDLGRQQVKRHGENQVHGHDKHPDKPRRTAGVAHKTRGHCRYQYHCHCARPEL